MSFYKYAFFTALLLCFTLTSFAQLQPYYDVTAGTGNGLRFWNGSNLYRITMGTGAQYGYGPVTNYSIKSSMNGTAGRGWTWGVNGQVPIGALSNTGNFQTAGWIKTKSLQINGQNSTSSVNGFGNKLELVGSAAAAIVFKPGDAKELMFGFHDNGNFYWGTGQNSSAPNFYPMILGGKTGHLTARGNIVSNNGDVGIGLNTYGGVKIRTNWPGATGGWSRGYTVANQNGTEVFFGVGAFGTISNGTTSMGYGWLGKSNTDNHMSFNVNGNVGVGTNSPAYKLQVVGPVAASTSLISGLGSGGVAMTVNDGYGNANLTFNHVGGKPEQNGNSGRITVNTDASVNAYMDFQLEHGGSAGVANALNSRFKLYSDGKIDIGSGDIFLNEGDGAIGNGSDIRFSSSGLIAADDRLYLNSNSDGTGSADIIFGTGSDTNTATQLAIIKGSSGNVGIGVDSPDQKLVVDGSIGLAYPTGLSHQGMRRAGVATEFYNNVTGATENVIYKFLNVNDEAIMSIEQGGSVGIGIDSPTEKFEVNGKIRTQEVIVTLDSWPDYVFDDTYDLMPLAELEKFIEKEKHLPNVPSASEVEDNGAQLGEMNKVLLEKVEELTLHLIEMNKRMEKLEEENVKLKKQSKK